MKTQKTVILVALSAVVLAIVALVAIWAKPKPRVEITAADLEITNVPANTAMLRFFSRTGSKIRIEGTANMIHPHWQVESPLIGGYLEVGPEFPTEPGQAAKPGKMAAHAEAFIMVRSLRSVEDNGQPYSDKMDEIMYEHLKAADDPKARITYRLTELKLVEPAKSADAPYRYEAKGELAVAGVTNPVTMPVFLTPLGDRKLKLAGSLTVKMTEFKVEPPAPAFLLLKTGDEVKLFYEWVVAPRNNPTNGVSAK